MEIKQTATDYLIQEIKNDALVQAKNTQEWNEVFKKAKQMEQEQIIETWKHGNLPTLLGRALTAEEYYNETYRDKK